MVETYKKRPEDQLALTPEKVEQSRLSAIPKIVVPASDAVKGTVEAANREQKTNAAQRVVTATYAGFEQAIMKSGDMRTKLEFQNSELHRLLS